MDDISGKRCALHKDREAAALCLQCSRYFCRECLTEHKGRVLCFQCLKKLTAPDNGPALRVFRLSRILHFLCGLALLWVFFYYVGQLLILLPTSFHEGTVWQTDWWNLP